MGKFIEILKKLNLIKADLDDGDELCRFFGLLKRFNGGRGIDPKIQLSIEKFFDYKWSHDKLMAIDDDTETALLQQLPLEV